MAGVRKDPHKNTGKYQGWYKDYTSKRKFFWGYTSKVKTRQLAEHLEDEHRQIRLGYRPVPKSEAGIKNRSFREAADEYLEWGNTQGGLRGKPWGKTHAKERKNKLAWWEKELKLRLVQDLEDSLSRVEQALRRLKKAGYNGKGQGVSGKTLGNYAETLQSFCKWAIKHGYLDADPLADLASFDESPESIRRALTIEEIHQLLNAAPEHRRLLYEVALTTGLRAGELRALTLDDIDVDRGIIRLDPAWTKNRKSGEQPIPRALVERLVAYGMKGTARELYTKRYGRCDAKPEGVPDHPLLYVSTHTSRELRQDLEAAGIDFSTGKGKADFHSLRTTFVTLAIEAGANLKEGQTLARHSTPQLTIGIYARTRDERLSDLVDKVGDKVIRCKSVPYMYHRA